MPVPIHRDKRASRNNDEKDWIPAFAGMTTKSLLLIKFNFKISSSYFLLPIELFATLNSFQGLISFC